MKITTYKTILPGVKHINIKDNDIRIDLLLYFGNIDITNIRLLNSNVTITLNQNTIIEPVVLNENSKVINKEIKKIIQHLCTSDSFNKEYTISFKKNLFGYASHRYTVKNESINKVISYVSFESDNSSFNINVDRNIDFIVKNQTIYKGSVNILRGLVSNNVLQYFNEPETHSFKKEWLFTISFPVVSCTSGLEFRLPHLRGYYIQHLGLSFFVRAFAIERSNLRLGDSQDVQSCLTFNV